MAKAGQVAKDETIHAMMDKAHAEAKSGKQPTMPTMADVEALTRESERICHDPRNQNKPA
jgi:hypothetical protein